MVIFSTSHSRKNKPEYIKMEEQYLEIIHHTKLLGIILDSFLHWSQHIEFVSGKLNKFCYAIRITARYLNEHTLRMIYHANFESVMSLIFWAVGTTVGSIFVIQKKVLRIILGWISDSHAEDFSVTQGPWKGLCWV